MQIPILSVILLTPVIGAILLLFISTNKDKTIKMISAFTSFVTLVLSAAVFFGYDKVAGGFQFVEFFPWVPSLGISYSLGLDGFSNPLVLLTSIIFFS